MMEVSRNTLTNRRAKEAPEELIVSWSGSQVEEKDKRAVNCLLDQSSDRHVLYLASVLTNDVLAWAFEDLVQPLFRGTTACEPQAQYVHDSNAGE